MSYHPDMILFARDYPEARLVVGVKDRVSSPPEQDPLVAQMKRYMWGASCHFGLIVTPETTYVLKDDFSKPTAESIRVTGSFPTSRMLQRVCPEGTTGVSLRELKGLVRAWLERLAAFYEPALPEDQAIQDELFPDLVGAVDGGRLVAEVAAP